jgi:hypothetical protein
LENVFSPIKFDVVGANVVVVGFIVVVVGANVVVVGFIVVVVGANVVVVGCFILPVLLSHVGKNALSGIP